MNRTTFQLAACAALVLSATGLRPVAAQDAAAGQRVFNQCRACHTVDRGGRNGVGPNLHGVVGRKAGAVEGFRYSASMKEKAEGGLTWTERDGPEVKPPQRKSFVSQLINGLAQGSIYALIALLVGVVIVYATAVLTMNLLILGLLLFLGVHSVRIVADGTPVLLRGDRTPRASHRRAMRRTRSR